MDNPSYNLYSPSVQSDLKALLQRDPDPVDIVDWSLGHVDVIGKAMEEMTLADIGEYVDDHDYDPEQIFSEYALNIWAEHHDWVDAAKVKQLIGYIKAIASDMRDIADEGEYHPAVDPDEQVKFTDAVYRLLDYADDLRDEMED
jgi:hypothetical protein